MKCPKCKAEDYVKAGIVKEKQRYICKKCRYYYTVENRGKSEKIKQYALLLYLEGLGFRSIGRFLQVSHVAVYNWIRNIGEKLEGYRGGSDLKVIEMDELHTYVGSKKKPAGYGLLLIDMGKSLSAVYLVAGMQIPGKKCGMK